MDLLTDANTKRETGKVAQIGNILATKVRLLKLELFVSFLSVPFSGSG